MLKGLGVRGGVGGSRDSGVSLVQAFGFRGLGLRVEALGCRVWGLGSRSAVVFRV